MFYLTRNFERQKLRLLKGKKNCNVDADADVTDDADFEKPMSIFPNSLVQSINRNTRKGCEICSKLKIRTPERRHQNDVIDVVQVLLFVTLNIFHTFY